MNALSKSVMVAATFAAAAFFPYLTGVAAQRAPAAAQGAPPNTAQGAARARAVSTVGTQGFVPQHEKFSQTQIESGGSLFLQNCAFCHGKDAGGGESGPDLTRSKLVNDDKNGEAIGSVLRNGRVEKGMPRFNSLSDTEIMSLVAWVHSQQDKAMSETGTRKGVEDADLQTGNAEAGKQYFNGPGGCTECHSATGDLAGVATRYTGLRLEQQMLYPRDVKEKVSVKTGTGQTLTGTLDYQDEFRIGMTDTLGMYHSWPVSAITFHVDNPVEAHVTAMSKYTDDDVHNVLAYIQTMK